MRDLTIAELQDKTAAVRAQLADALARFGRLVYSNSLGAEAMVLTDIIWTHFPADRHLQHRHRTAARGDLRAAGEACSAATGAACGSSTRTPRALETPGRAPGRQRFLRQSRGAPGVLPHPQGGAVPARDRRLPAPGSPACAASSPAVAPTAQLEEWDARVRTLQDQPAAGLERGGGVAATSARTSCRTMRCTTDSYPSIGCSPCTRAIQPGESRRAGRWWWEQPESRECGLHPRHPAGGPPPPPCS